VTINYEHLLNYPIPEIRQTIRWQDTALYNFSIGLGQDPMDQQQLDFLYEPRLKAMPAMANVLGYPGFWLRNPDTGVDWTQVLHGEQSLILHKPLPAEGEIIGKSRISAIVDRGPGKGALLYNERVVLDAKTGEKLATLEGTTFARGDGGFGGPSGPVKKPHAEPDRAPDVVVDLPTRPEQAIVYRLSGDANPLHIDPETAQRAGFSRPILHGLASYGIAGVAVSRALGQDPSRIAKLGCGFSGVVLPGDTLTFHVWKTPAGAVFQAWSDGRKLLDEGVIEWSAN